MRNGAYRFVVAKDTGVANGKHPKGYSQYHLSTLVSDYSQDNWHREFILSYAPSPPGC